VKKLLLVDDEEAIRMIYREEFESDGYEVVTAADGPNGLECFRSAQPDLVILDIHMPGMNGVEVLRQMKMENATIPVILSSAYQEYKRDLGTWAADDYVVKSGNLDDLKNTVRRLLKSE
jgi:two-component system, response regulator, stage 0 sporulation protein F